MLQEIGTFFDRYKGYLFGKAMLSLLVIGAASVLNVPMIAAAGLLVGGNTLLSIYGRLTQQRYYEDEMVDLYRDDMAKSLGKSPEQITRSDLKEAAKSNEVIEQALARQHKATVISIGTTLLANAVTFALLVPFGDAGKFHDFTKATFGKLLGPLVNAIGIGTVSGISGVILHDGLSFLIGAKVGTHKAVAHDMIRELDADVKRGKAVSREQVYEVLVAGNDTLQQKIIRDFNKPYNRLSVADQSRVLHSIGVANEMDTIAQAINNGEIRAGRLAYMMDDGRALRRAIAPQETELSPEQSNFVERLKLQPRNERGFAAQIDAERGDGAVRAI